jgi:predicted phage terminase large subunit-like protein
VRALERIKRVLGSRSFAALYQGRPIPAEGGLFNREWFRVVRRAPDGLRWVRFWDTAAKATQRSDFWAGALMARAASGEWCVGDMVRGRWEYPQAKQVVLQTAEADGEEVVIGIEDTASGTALLQDLRRDPRAQGYVLRAVPVKADKAVRAGAWASQAEGGLVSLVAGEWVRPFLDEVETFPFGAHDDQVDAVSGAFEMLAQAARAARLPFVMAGQPRPVFMLGSGRLWW